VGDVPIVINDVQPIVSQVPTDVAPVTPAVNTAPVAAPVVDQGTQDLTAEQEAREKAEQAYRVLQGKYNAETKELRADTKRSQEELKSLRELIEKKDEEANVDPNNPFGFTEEELGYGEEVTGIAQKIAQNVVGREVDKLRNELESKQATERAQSDATNNFFSTLDKVAKKWKDDNDDPEFLLWLGQVDPLSHQLRSATLETAEKDLNPYAAAAIFNAYRASKAVPIVAPVVTQPQQPSLQSQVMPQTAASAPQPVQPEGRIYTVTEIQAMATALTQKDFTEKRAVEIEEIIDSAYREGRVVPD